MDKALEHFDDFYASVYEDTWPDIRCALLEEESKYMAIVNNFSDTERVRSNLELLGAINLKSLYNLRKEKLDAKAKRRAKIDTLQIKNPEEVEIFKDKLTELQPVNLNNYRDLCESLNAKRSELEKSDEQNEFVELLSIDKNLNEVNLDHDRIVDPSVNLSSLQEYVPVTEIKGMDEWVMNSDHYKFYHKGEDFNINVEREFVLPFPEHLHAYSFEKGNKAIFPSAKKGSTGVSDYYLFDGGSILPILALDIKLGDTVLDMCAAPGGKALTILQTLMPRLLVVNDIKESKVNKIKMIMNQYTSDIYKGENMLIIKQGDARRIDETGVYNKILVDVPCTVDRHVLHSDVDNLFKPNRVKERLTIPTIQNALKLVTVGGTVVYSTCTLSPVQNDGVIQATLQKAWQENDIVTVVKDMTKALLPLRYLYNFGKNNVKYGHIVIPTIQNNWGPMYFCKIVKVQ
ncbi:Putative methyltransferase NSUN4 [Eufriesea mexicana]|uniref:NOL1/NOP2/Sun domain family member 4 n=1 Tax=Eufriesea mexicana TaxID=516756 RepID=A0A310SAQ9_9HYME|nr:Putative methyltransferase NSUN4 [Eufriesea mexicana]